jgi:hypothetical protein
MPSSFSWTMMLPFGSHSWSMTLNVCGGWSDSRALSGNGTPCRLFGILIRDPHEVAWKILAALRVYEAALREREDADSL